MSGERGKKRIVLAVTGASGAVYAERLFKALIEAGHTVDLVLSSYGARLLKEERDLPGEPRRFVEAMRQRHDLPLEEGQVVAHANQDLGASISSGSFPVHGMAVVPASMRTVGAVAAGLGSTLVDRAAAVTLKERRPLVIVPRETPLNRIHLENLLRLHDAGAVILPADPAFYQSPRTFEDLGDFIAARVMEQLASPHPGISFPGGERSDRSMKGQVVVGDPDQKARIRSLFDGVAPRYDLLNRLLSAGIDRKWRRDTIAALGLGAGDRLLDVCAGTGDLGYEALRQVASLQVVGVDLARQMLIRGKGKEQEGVYGFVQGDAERLPLAGASVDAACVGFGIRNVSSLDAAFTEVNRVLRPGGRFAVLEFTTPPNPVVRGAYHAYFHHVLPRIGGWVSGSPEAYAYLPESVARFPDPPSLAGILGRSGFQDVTWSLFTGGIAALHICRR